MRVRQWPGVRGTAATSEHRQGEAPPAGFLMSGGSPMADTTSTITDCTPRVWPACLACYNNGRLVGEWVDCTDAGNVTLAELHKGSGGPFLVCPGSDGVAGTGFLCHLTAGGMHGSSWLSTGVPSEGPRSVDCRPQGRRRRSKTWTSVTRRSTTGGARIESTAVSSLA